MNNNEEFVDAFELGKQLKSMVATLNGKIIFPLVKFDKSLVITIPKTQLRMAWLRSLDDKALAIGWTVDYLQATHEWDKEFRVKVLAGYKIWMRVT